MFKLLGLKFGSYIYYKRDARVAVGESSIDNTVKAITDPFQISLSAFDIPLPTMQKMLENGADLFVFMRKLLWALCGDAEGTVLSAVQAFYFAKTSRRYTGSGLLRHQKHGGKTYTVE